MAQEPAADRGLATASPAAPAPAPPGAPSARAFAALAVAIVLGAALWRIVMAAALPTIARDGVTFCWLARDLDNLGLGALRTAEFRQHPLYPMLILGVQRVLRAAGAADAPLTWQHAGQFVSLTGGLAVVVLCGWLTSRIAHALAAPAPRSAVLAALVLAAVSDLNVWLSADVMSDQPHAALYLLAVILLLDLRAWPAAVGCGLASGLAFLTREEGFVPALGALLVLAREPRLLLQQRAVRALLVAVAFLACAAPYWALTGQFSPKKELFDIAPAQAAAPVAAGAALAKLETIDLSWYSVAPHVAYKLLRAGRVTIPLLALAALIAGRRRLLVPPLAGPTACLAGHLALATLLLARYDYLSTRHLLPAVLLLVPFAALALAAAGSRLAARGRPGLAPLLVALAALPLAAYATRVPNAGDAYLRAAAEWLRTTQPAAGRTLVCGSSPTRVAFYADLHWVYWPEQPEHYGALRRLLLASGPGYLALETGPGFERAGNRELVDQLRADRRLAAQLGPVHERPGPSPDVKLLLIEWRGGD